MIDKIAITQGGMMSIRLKSTDVQQNFGRVMDQALLQNDVIVERYGEPRIAIIGYQRYLQLLQAEQALNGPYLQRPDQSVEARRKAQALAEKIREELANMEGTLEDTMASLRGRSSRESL